MNDAEYGSLLFHSFVLFCFKSALLEGLTRPMQDKRKAKSCPRGLNHLSRPPQSHLPPILFHSLCNGFLFLDHRVNFSDSPPAVCVPRAPCCSGFKSHARLVSARMATFPLYEFRNCDKCTRDLISKGN
jgi:hypothetical protein